MIYYKRKLPHWQIQGAEYFVTFRLAGSLPIHVVKSLQLLRKKYQKSITEKTENKKDSLRKFELKIFKKYEDLLDKCCTGPRWLEKPKISKIIKDSIHYRDGNKYDLYAYCIMSNHVHMVFKHIENQEIKSSSESLPPITRILKNLKSYTALQANKILEREGAFWNVESYDHLIRNNTELENIIRYTIYNPVKANLVENWEDWQQTYCKPIFLESFT
ncbi:transposase [Rhodohalobacter sulfatireducens]|uniref:Transposase IS200-like domain-containing protein n=1 Tax=Rhodohalobacter sulfatireducens TaxID=2911366 RepID=A0ABS9KJU5_9BACT|nr:transposase [Rhodohalobacter sulfatireducens]MCG2591122.1 hypothetical protein [Rhodohalobacter sulfatireducens]